LGFFADGKLKTLELNGSSVQVVCDAQLGRGGAWGPDGMILFSASPSSPLLRVTASGGSPDPLTKIDTAQHTSHRWPFFLPDGKHFLYLALHHDPSKSANNTLYYASLDGRENRPLFRSQSNAVYARGFLREPLKNSPIHRVSVYGVSRGEKASATTNFGGADGVREVRAEDEAGAVS
jgi:hypothetical protein